MAAIEEFLADAKRRMDRSIEATHHEFNSIRTGRASPALLDRITIDYYGTQTPLKSLASISAPEPRLLVVQPFDPGAIKGIERAVQESDLGLTPSNDGKVVRLPIPALTEERRKELVKQVKKTAEEHKIGVREARRSGLVMLKDLEAEGDVTADDRRRVEKQIQDLTDAYVGKIDEAISRKEAEILEV
jgi:ribosome recycling factor